MLELNSEEVSKAVKRAVLMNILPYISGPAAIGKSQIGQQVAEEFNLQMIDLRLSRSVPEDFTGFPVNKGDGTAGYITFDTFPMTDTPLPDGKDGWLIFLDELSSASRSVLVAAYELILDRSVGGRPLHKRVRMIAAGNRSKDSAIAEKLPDTIITRMIMLEMKVDAPCWLQWASKTKRFHPTLLGFISKHPGMLYTEVAIKDRVENEPVPRPRTWEMVNKIIMQNGGLNSIDEVNNHLILGAVGTFAGQSFVEFYEEANQIPEVTDVCQSPSTTVLPNSDPLKKQLVQNLAGAFPSQFTQARDNILIYLNRLEPEFREVFTFLIKNTVDKVDYEVLVKRLKGW